MGNRQNEDAIGEHVILMGSASSVKIGQADPVATVSSYAKKRGFGLKGHVFTITIATSLILLVLAVYWSFVLMNLTFVFDPNLKHTDIPFYKEPDSSAGWKQADRYGAWWILISTSFLRLVSVVGTHMVLSNAALTGQVAPMNGMRAFILLYGLIDFGIAVFYLVIAYSHLCEGAPICRNWDSVQEGDPLPSDQEPNRIFLFLTWFSFVFTAVHIAYYIVLGGAIERIEEIRRSIALAEENKEV